jgi:hypothetical protein
VPSTLLVVLSMPWNPLLVVHISMPSVDVHLKFYLNAGLDRKPILDLFVERSGCLNSVLRR